MPTSGNASNAVASKEAPCQPLHLQAIMGPQADSTLNGETRIHQYRLVQNASSRLILFVLFVQRDSIFAAFLSLSGVQLSIAINSLV